MNGALLSGSHQRPDFFITKIEAMQKGRWTKEELDALYKDAQKLAADLGLPAPEKPLKEENK